MDGGLNVITVADAEAGVYYRRCSAPVLVDLHAAGSGFDLLFYGSLQAAVALAIKAYINREGFGACQHTMEVENARAAGGGDGACRRTDATADEGRHACRDGIVTELGSDEVNMGVDTASGEDHTFAGNHIGARPDHKIRMDVFLDMWITGFAYAFYLAVFYTDIGFDNPPPV